LLAATAVPTPVPARARAATTAVATLRVFMAYHLSVDVSVASMRKGR
jgi:hypothetical protein